MNYALITNGIVTNVIWLDPRNAGDFLGAIALGDRPVGIGDIYADGAFTRDGQPIQTPLEAAEATIAELDTALVDAEYQNVLLSMGVEI